MCERWVGDGDRLPHIDPQVPLTIAALLSHSDGLLNRGSWGPKPSFWHLISNWICNSNSNCPKPSVAPGYIIVWRSPASCGCMHLHRIQTRPQVKVIFRHPRPDAPVSSAYLHRCISWLTARSRANMQQLSHFSSRPSPSPSTHILQILLKDNNSRKKHKKKLLEPQQKYKKKFEGNILPM